MTPADPRAPSVDAAFAGFTRPAAEAFNRHGVGRVVGVSMLGRGTPWAARAGFVTGSLAMDDLIAASGVAQGYTDMAWAKNEGLDNGVQRIPENSTPTSFRQWCEEVLKPAVAS